MKLDEWQKLNFEGKIRFCPTDCNIKTPTGCPRLGKSGTPSRGYARRFINVESEFQ